MKLLLSYFSYLREEYEQNKADIVLTHEDWQREVDNIEKILGTYDVKTT